MTKNTLRRHFETAFLSIIQHEILLLPVSWPPYWITSYGVWLDADIWPRTSRRLRHLCVCRAFCMPFSWLNSTITTHLAGKPESTILPVYQPLSWMTGNNKMSCEMLRIMFHCCGHRIPYENSMYCQICVMFIVGTRIHSHFQPQIHDSGRHIGFPDRDRAEIFFAIL